MEARRLRVLALEIFYSANKLNLVYMQSLFEKNVNSRRSKDNLKVHLGKFVTFGDKNVRLLGSHIWNMLLAELKREISYGKFKAQIDNWFGPNVTVELASM